MTLLEIFFFKIVGTLNQHGHHSSDMPSSLVYSELSHHLFFNRDNDPKHTQRLFHGYLTKKGE